MNPSHNPSLDQNQFWCIWTKKKSKIPPPCQIKKIMFFFLRHIMEFLKHLLTRFRPKKRLIILITYYSQYSCKKNQEKNQKNHTVFIATKAKFIWVSIFFHEHIFLLWEFLLLKKLEIQKTKTTFVITVLKVVYKVVLVYSISNFFINKISQERKMCSWKKYLPMWIQL